MRGLILHLTVLVLASLPLGAAAQTPARDDSASEQLGWHLGVQAWTFRDRTAFEAIDTAAKLGLKYIELYPGQALSPEQREAKVGPELNDALRDALRKKLAAAKVKAASFGVVSFGKSEVEARKVFEFAKKLGMECISCEPAPEAWEMVDRLANEYGISAAIHNHPKPSRYWHPDSVLEAVQGLSRRLGACADTGHWSRSGLRPVACLRRLQGRVVEVHFKDIADGVDKPWGTGQCDARAMLAELRRQAFRGLISIEYEDGEGAALEANVARCIAFFDQATRELAK